jgi:polyribonucleotide nucleotidyltransferase
MEIARSAIEAISAKPEIGKIYRGKVVTIKEFGAFVEFMPGKDGLCHISELANFRVKQVEDIVKMGDEIWVKVLEIDEKGKIRLSRKAAMAERDAAMGGGEAGAPPAEGQQGEPVSAGAPEGEAPARPEYRERGGGERREPRGDRGGGDRGPRRDGGGRGSRN